MTVQRVREEQKNAIRRLIQALKGLTPQITEVGGGAEEYRFSGESTTYPYSETRPPSGGGLQGFRRSGQ